MYLGEKEEEKEKEKEKSTKDKQANDSTSSFWHSFPAGAMIENKRRAEQGRSQSNRTKVAWGGRGTSKLQKS